MNEPTPQNSMTQVNLILTVVIVAASIFFLLFLLGGGIQKSVAVDAEIRYAAVREGGTLTDVCVAAGLAAEAYLQAQDTSNYQRWKVREKSDCAMAGVYR